MREKVVQREAMDLTWRRGKVVHEENGSPRTTRRGKSLTARLSGNKTAGSCELVILGFFEIF